MMHKTKIGSIEIGGESKFFRFEEKDDFRIAFALTYDEENSKLMEDKDVDAVPITIKRQD